MVKANWDTTKSYSANLSDMGLAATPNHKLERNAEETVASPPPRSQVIELFDVPQSNDGPSFAQRFPLSLEDEKYMGTCMQVHGDDYLNMFRDTKVNTMQYTEAKLRKLGSKYLALSADQRRVPVPDEVEQLLSSQGSSA